MTALKIDPSAPCVLLVEDSRELASAMVRTLVARGCTVHLAKSYTEARILIDRDDLRLDAAVLDHRLPDGDSRELVSALANRNPSCSSLVLTGYGGQDLALDYRSRGVFHYATKPIAGAHLVSLVNATIHNSYYWRRMIDGTATDDVPPVVVLDFEQAAERLRHIAALSPIETEVAYWVLQGLRDAEIAPKIRKAERTTKRHVSRVLSKVGVKNRASLWMVLSQDSDPRAMPEPAANGGKPATHDGDDDDDDGDDDDDAAHDDEWSWQGARGRVQAPP